MVKYIGIDAHNQYLFVTVVDEEGKVIKKDKVSTDRSAIKEYFEGVRGEDKVKAVIEACYSWSYVYDEVRPLVDEIIVAHPLKTRLIAEARIKTDSIDSQTLAELLRANLIPKAYAPSFETRDKKNLMRYRFNLVRLRSMQKNAIHALLARNHIEDITFRGLSDKFGKSGMEYMRQVKLQGCDTEILNNYLDSIEVLNKKIDNAEQKIRGMVKEDEISKLLKSISGIGDILALLVRYEIDDINRFCRVAKLFSYAGLVPSTYSTGGKTYQGRITKQGNRWLRWAMVEAAQKAILNDFWLKGCYDRITQRRGKKKGIVAIARKLLGIIYRVWKEKRPYKKKSVAVALCNV